MVMSVSSHITWYITLPFVSSLYCSSTSVSPLPQFSVVTSTPVVTNRIIYELECEPKLVYKPLRRCPNYTTSILAASLRHKSWVQVTGSIWIQNFAPLDPCQAVYNGQNKEEIHISSLRKSKCSLQGMQMMGMWVSNGLNLIKTNAGRKIRIGALAHVKIFQDCWIINNV